MTITNETGVSAAIYNAIAALTYSGESEKRFASVTELVDPVWRRFLQRHYARRITEDAMDNIWTFLGTGVHELIHKANVNDVHILTEERLSAEIDGAKITGGVDLYHEDPEAGTCTITDIKVTSVYAIIYRNRLKEWTRQLNAYAWLFRQAGFRVDKLSITAILRDWSRNKAKQGGDYPQTQLAEIEIRLWNKDITENWLRKRIRAIRNLDLDADDMDMNDDLLEALGSQHGCSAEERWDAPTTYAIMKEGNVKATKVCKSRSAAEATGKLELPKHSLQVRQGTSRRCEDYCNVAEFCPVWKRIQEEAA